MTVKTTDFYLTQIALGYLRRAEAILKHLETEHFRPEFLERRGDPDIHQRYSVAHEAGIVVGVAIDDMSGGRAWESARARAVEMDIPPLVQRCIVCGVTEAEWASPDLCVLCSKLDLKIIRDTPS